MAKLSSLLADEADDELADAEWDDFAQLLEDFRHQRAKKGRPDHRRGSKVMEELKFIGPKEPPADYIVYPSIYPGQNVEDEDADDNMYFMPATNVVCSGFEILGIGEVSEIETIELSQKTLFIFEAVLSIIKKAFFFLQFLKERIAHSFY